MFPFSIPHAIHLSYLGVFWSKSRMKVLGFKWAKRPGQSLFWATPSVPLSIFSALPHLVTLECKLCKRPWDSAYTWSRPVTFSSTATSSLVILACSLCPHSCLGLGSPPPPLLAWRCPQLEADRTVYKAQPTMTPRAVSPPRLSVHVRILLELMRGLEEREQKPTP